VAFPADYGSAELAGKTAQFEVTIKAVEQPRLPALDAAFATQLGVADGDRWPRCAPTSAPISSAKSRSGVRARTKASVMEALPQLADIELPSALVNPKVASSPSVRSTI
jgi:trigger factor